MNNKLTNIGYILVILGNLLGIALSVIMIWADMEANLFKYGVRADKKLHFFDCPILLNNSEESAIKVRLRNNRDKVMTPFIRAYVSEEDIFLSRQSATDLTIQPGDRAEVIWKIYPEDAVYDKFVFFRIFLNDDYPYPNRYGTCGVWVTNIPGLSGPQIIGLIITMTLLLLIGGNYLLQKYILSPGKENTEFASGLKYLSVLTLIDLLLAQLGLWVLGLILLTVILVVSFVLLIRFITRESIA
jgi:hypothetical protein